jgi:hypothetical protein
MLHVSIDVSAVLARFDAVAERLEHFGPNDMPAELTEWQREDMNRKFPSTEMPDERTAFTRIWPRSRLSDQRRVVRRPRRAGRPLRVLRTAAPAGNRPILRPSLFERLCERMAALLPERIHF